MDNKKRLLQLIKIMKIPFTDEEAKEFVDKLSEEKAAKIVSVYEDIKKFEDNLEFVVKNTNPEAYEKAREEYLKSIPLARMGEANEVANLVCFLLSNASSYITGEVIKIDGGLYI